MNSVLRKLEDHALPLLILACAAAFAAVQHQWFGLTISLIGFVFSLGIVVTRP